jgi:uncharacterized protein with ParB-like and HNH nuclease domain
MNGKEQYFLQFMEGTSSRFIIPVYQRNYEWKLEQCKQLYDDLIRVSKENKPNHFFGSIVSSPVENGEMGHHLLIDGQQRVTTVSLLLLAIAHAITKKNISSSTPHLAEKVMYDYLIDQFEAGEKRIKLKTVKDDLNSYSALFDGSEEINPYSNLTINYRYFLDRIQKQEISVDSFYDSIKKLQIINIYLGTDDNAQLIFESLNSTGVDLTEGDKVRNYVLMGLRTSLQEEYFRKYWYEIEKNTEFNVSFFLRDYLSIKNQTTPVLDRVYPAFKAFVQSNSENQIEPILADLLKYSKLYKQLLNPTEGSLLRKRCIGRLHHFEATVTRPFLIEVLHSAQEQQELLPEKEVEKIFLLVESYLLRRQVTEIPSNALNKIFVTLHWDILRLDDTFNDYFNKINFVLLQKTESGIFPDDSDFLNALSTKRIYQMRAKSKQYILERLENKDSKEYKDIWGNIEKGIYSIEHVMPQTLSAEWREMLGPDHEAVHTEWVDRLANLTLTAYNPDYSNYPFEYKKTMKHGFADSGIAMNLYIAKLDKWTLESLKERNDMLMKLALELWPMAKTTYQPPEDPLEVVSLADGINITGRKISKFSLNGAVQNVDSWVDMMVKVISQIYANDPLPINQAILNPTSQDGLSGSFVSIPSKEDYYYKIGDSLFVNIQNDRQTKLGIIRSIFSVYKLEEADLLFYLQKSTSIPKPTPTDRGAIRLRFWEFALPILQQRTSKFKNNQPSQSNWLDANYDLKGVRISIIANLDNVRVDFCIGTKNKELNNSIYQYLKDREIQIQGKFDQKIDWLNKPEYKCSYLSIHNSEIGIGNKTDWEKCAEFFAKMSYYHT